MADELDKQTEWSSSCISAAAIFAKKCAELAKNIGKETTLNRVINDLMTELWDNGFSQPEIKTAFEKAVQDMPRYAAGEERRGDKQ